MNTNQRASILQEERDRLFVAWRKRQGIDLNDLLRMTGEEISHLKHLAEASDILIPRTEDAYLYHGTSAARAARIKEEGLETDKPSNWHKTGHGLHVRGRVFFADTVPVALFYASEAAKSRPALLRVPETELKDRKPDPLNTFPALKDEDFPISRRGIEPLREISS